MSQPEIFFGQSKFGDKNWAKIPKRKQKNFQKYIIFKTEDRSLTPMAIGE